MSSFGFWGSFPFTFGGEEEPEESAHYAMLDALAPEPGIGFDTSDPLLIAEVAAHASVVGGIWDINERVRRQALPLSMLEALPEAEEALRIRPTPEQTDDERRAIVAAKTIALKGNTIPEIEEAVRAIAGNQFVTLYVPPESAVVTYYPLNPGPPGLEWMSTRCFVRIQLTKEGLTDDATFYRMRSAIEDLLNQQLPASHIFAVNTGTGFIIGESLIGETGI